MKISDLNKITARDIKNYDWRSLKDHLLSDPTPIFCFLAVVITITAVSIAYRTYKGAVKTQRIEIPKLRNRVEALNSFEIVQKHHSDFLAKAPKAISENKLIEILSEIALARSVQILSFSPTSKKSAGPISLTSVEITVASENYADTVRFTRDIENLPHSIRIGKWYGDLKMPVNTSRRFLQRPGQQGTTGAIKNEYIEAKIKIETVEFGK